MRGEIRWADLSPTRGQEQGLQSKTSSNRRAEVLLLVYRLTARVFPSLTGSYLMRNSSPYPDDQTLIRRMAHAAVAAAALVACLAGTSCTSNQGTTETEFQFTFQSGAEGWTAGFADLPADFDPSIYELDSGHRPLPPGLEGNGLYIQGHNRSDDLFMFFKRRIDGLMEDADYEVFASLDLATNVAAGLVGIGGSPGESVFVKVGASTVEPQAVGENLRMNIDKGNQANSGETMVVVGNAAHPEVEGDEYRLKSLDNADNPVRVTTDGEGGLWLIVGTDSGFEGLSRFYYARIAYTLRPVNSSAAKASPLGPSSALTPLGEPGE